MDCKTTPALFTNYNHNLPLTDGRKQGMGNKDMHWLPWPDDQRCRSWVIVPLARHPHWCPHGWHPIPHPDLCTLNCQGTCNAQRLHVLSLPKLLGSIHDAQMFNTSSLKAIMARGGLLSLWYLLGMSREGRAEDGRLCWQKSFTSNFQLTIAIPCIPTAWCSIHQTPRAHGKIQAGRHGCGA